MKQFRLTPKVRAVTAKLGSVFGTGEPSGDGGIIDNDNGKPLFRSDIVDFLNDELTKRKSEKSVLELQWTLNANFLMGNQFCDINTHTNSVEQIPAAYDWMERKAYNRIAPLIETRIANLKRINYAMTVKPATDELDDYQKAEVSTAILQHAQEITDFHTLKNTMIAWNELCGSCFWIAGWNPDKGEEVAYEQVLVTDGEGVRMNDTKAYKEGDIEYGLITPYEIYPESIFKQGIENQRSIIIEQVKTVDDVYDLYGIEVEGTSAETFQLTPAPVPSGYGEETTIIGMGKHTIDNAVKVITYLEKPSRRRPHGRMIIMTGDDKIIFYGELPYGRIPIVQVVCKEVAGQFFGKSVIEELIPLQKAYNGCKNRIHEYIKRIAIQSFYAPEGSVDVDLFEETGLAPGHILEYDPGMGPPTPMQNGILPNDVMQEQYNLANDMEYVAGVSQMMVTGNTPKGINSGVAIQNLRDIDDTRMSLTGDNIRNSVKKLAILSLEIYKRYATVSRAMQYVGTNNLHMAITWSSEDINSYDVEFTTENELIYSEEIQEQRFMQAYQMGLFTNSDGVIPEKFKHMALKNMKIGQFSDIMSINDLHAQAAQRENMFFEKGIIPEISDIDDHQTHIDEHMRYVLQMKYQILKSKKPEFAQIMADHIKQHEQAVETEKAQKAMMMQGGNDNE
ncbi:MAG: hypothetical protein J6N52_03700 [Clostridia bacterium]|nr:hypothetical protein [Clostridia bacterium]